MGVPDFLGSKRVVTHSEPVAEPTKADWQLAKQLEDDGYLFDFSECSLTYKEDRKQAKRELAQIFADARAEERKTVRELINKLLRADGFAHITCPVCCERTVMGVPLRHREGCALAGVEALMGKG